jgi:hypothetical protein
VRGGGPEKVEVKRMESEKILTKIKTREVCFLSHPVAFNVPIENRSDVDLSMFMAGEAGTRNPDTSTTV